MTMKAKLFGAVMLSGVMAVVAGAPVQALTMKECSVKYDAAKKAGNTAKWNDFRKAECGADAPAAAAPAAAAPAAEAKPAATPKGKAKEGKAKEAAPAAAPAATAPPAPAAAEPKAATRKSAAPAPAPAPAAAPAAAGNAVFPTAVNAKYASESAGKARMHTCLDQYNANKDNGGNGGMKWIQKGGGYYSECNTRLK
ncbi:MAG: hypothetical protein FWD68_04630 [Alphaproteobacteria bacterium]|nr:hypothetical protein [Alphaproteobacteria bacterium]